MAEQVRTTHSVLIVEDEYIIATSIQRSLQKLGYHISGICDNSDRLLAIIKEEQPDIVLMDIGINGSMDGIAAAETIYRRWGIPVVYISGLLDGETASRIPESLPFGYVAKPFTPAELRIAISIALYRAESERRIKTQEIRIQQLLEQMKQGFCLLDADGRMQYANQTVLEFMKVPLQELLSADPRKLAPSAGPLLDLMEGREPNADTYMDAQNRLQLHPFTSRVTLGKVNLTCYIIPHIIYSDENPATIQGCFVSIIDIGDVVRTSPN